MTQLQKVPLTFSGLGLDNSVFKSLPRDSLACLGGNHAKAGPEFFTFQPRPSLLATLPSFRIPSLCSESVKSGLSRASFSASSLPALSCRSILGCLVPTPKPLCRTGNSGVSTGSCNCCQLALRSSVAELETPDDLRAPHLIWSVLLPDGGQGISMTTEIWPCTWKVERASQG